MGDTGGLDCVRVRLRGPGHAGDQPLGGIHREGATPLGNKVKHRFGASLPPVPAGLAPSIARPHLSLLGGAA